MADALVYNAHMTIVLHQHLNVVEHPLVIPAKTVTDLHVVVNPVNPDNPGAAVVIDHLASLTRRIVAVVLRQRSRTDDLSAIVVHAAKDQDLLARIQIAQASRLPRTQNGAHIICKDTANMEVVHVAILIQVYAVGGKQVNAKALVTKTCFTRNDRSNISLRLLHSFMQNMLDALQKPKRIRRSRR